MLPDNYDLFLKREAERENELARLPRCTECNGRIQDDYLYVINDEPICERCLNKEYRKRTEDYII